MNCPRCRRKTRTYRTHDTDKPLGVERHRVCTACNYRFVTHEGYAREVGDAQAHRRTERADWHRRKAA